MESREENEWPGRWSFTVAVIALCWVFSMLSILSWLILPLAGFALLRASRRGAWRPFLLLLLVNPMGVYFICGMADYAKGAPKLHHMGLPSIESYNIEPNTRAFHQTGGCLVRGNEWVSQGFHNLGVLALAAVLGPPSRSYDGPYPTEEEARCLSSSAPALNISDFLKGRIPVGGETLEMSSEQIRTIAQDLRLFALVYDGDPVPSGISIQAVKFESRCLILRFVEFDSYTDTTVESADRDFLVLFDRNNMRPFAYYQLTGDSATRYPKIQYLSEHSR
ncbi:MAG TPA: hypothetical protein VF258_05405 [Luteolibacter sp.]